MSDSFVPGVVLWFKPESGRGVVKAEGGRQFFVDASCGIEEPVRGLRVLVREISRISGPARAELRLPPGGRHIVELDPVEAKTKKKPAVKRTRKKLGGDGGAPKKRVPKGVVQRVKRKGEALERGIPVLHATHGQGFVVMSTSKIARIKFPTGERQVRVADLQVLERS